MPVAHTGGPANQRLAHRDAGSVCGVTVHASEGTGVVVRLAFAGFGTAWDLRSFRWAYRGTAVPVKAAVLTRLLSYRGEPVADSGENNSSP